MELQAIIDTQVIDDMINLHGYTPELAIEETLNMLRDKFLKNYYDEKKTEELQKALRKWYEHEDCNALLNFMYDNENFMWRFGYKEMNSFMRGLF